MVRESEKALARSSSENITEFYQSLLGFSKLFGMQKGYKLNFQGINNLEFGRKKENLSSRAFIVHTTAKQIISLRRNYKNEWL